MDYIKTVPITTLILIYLFSCGLLYLIGFWTTFDIDVFNLISIYDIPKSFLFPFVISNGFYLLSLTFKMIPNLTDTSGNINSFISEKGTWSYRKNKIITSLTNIDLLLYLSIYTWYNLIEKPLFNMAFWILSGYLISYRLTYKLVNSELIVGKITNTTIRMYLANLCIFIPISCFVIGKVKSLTIYNNSNIKTIAIDPINSQVQKSEKSCSLKLLGFISDNIIVSEIDNSKVYIYKQGNVNKLIINNYR